MFGGFRRKMKYRAQYDDDESDMEAGFDEIDQEEKYSRMIGAKEDEREFKLIQLERQKELEKLKKKR